MNAVARVFAGTTLVIASHNPGKVREIADLLAPLHCEFVPAATLGLPEPEETARTFAGNAEIKALAAARGSGHPALADDSGLAVAALDGAPGVFSARWAGPGKDFGHAMHRVNDAVAERDRSAGAPVSRAARFVCALSLAWPDGHVETVEGTVCGHLAWPPRGTGGFGYDPIFVPDGHDLTFGELAPERKHAISHRAAAFRRLCETVLPVP